MRTTLTLKETVKVNDLHREFKLENPSITFREVCSIFFKERHKKDIEKAKKEYPKVRAVEKKLKRRKPLQEKNSNPWVPARKKILERISLTTSQLFLFLSLLLLPYNTSHTIHKYTTHQPANNTQ